jgi:hypothetical protein
MAPTLPSNYLLNVQVDTPQFQTSQGGSGTAALGLLNCPAGVLSAPFTWLKVLAPDGSICWVPAWK